MSKKAALEPTNIPQETKTIKIFGVGFREFKFFIIISWIVAYCIKHWTSPAALSRLNPGLPGGGKGQLSKQYVYNYFTKNNVVAKKYFTRCILIPANMQWTEIKKRLKIFNTKPVVLKPENGARSIGVKVTTTDDERLSLLSVRKNMNYIAQEYIPYPHELGVYYYRYPNQKGRILGIAEKKFQIITGNGQNTLKELLRDITITKPIQTQLLVTYHNLNYIPSKNEKIMLANTVDHDDQGEYYNREDLITPAVEKIFNKIVGNRGIYFCRFDVRAKSISEFAKGKEFKILEINTGSNAIFLHAFDPRYDRKKQLKRCFDGYRTAFKIAETLKNNPRQKLIPYLWFMMKDEIPLFFLRHRIEKLDKEITYRKKHK